jgi:hypothetical protein
MPSRIWVSTALASLPLALAACGKDAATSPDPAFGSPLTAAVASQAPPVDHLAADELVEGSKLAFGLKLPRDLQVDGAFVDVVFASGRVAVEPLVKYFRARLTEGSLRAGEESATFEHVHIPGKASSEYGVRIWLARGYTRVEIRDTTPKPQPDLPDDAARWRQAGLTPQGRVLDPTHLQ